MSWSMVAFSAFSTIAIISSIFVILKKNPVSSAFSLILVFFSFAGLYAVMGAHLVAALQIMVYTGAIMVLFVFVIMLLNADTPVLDLKESGGLFKAITTFGVIGLLGILLKTVLRAKEIQATGNLTEDKINELGGNFKVISEALFTDYSFHFELASFLLLGAIVATVALAKRKSLKGSSV